MNAGLLILLACLGVVLGVLLVTVVVFRRELEASAERTTAVRRELEAALGELAERDQSADLRWKADRRAIQAWQQAHPGHDHVWPDHADLVVWLLGELEAREGAFQALSDNTATAIAHYTEEAAGFDAMRAQRDRYVQEAAEAREVLLDLLGERPLDVVLDQERRYTGPVAHAPLVVAAVAAAARIARLTTDAHAVHDHRTYAYDGVVHCYTCDVTRHGQDGIALWRRTPTHLRAVIAGEEPGHAARE